MAIKHEADLNAQLFGCWLKALAAIELRNFDYAIELLQNLLRQEPEFLAGRQMLRRAEVTRLKTEPKRFFKISAAPLTIMKAQRELKKDPRRAIELIEKILETNPHSSQANLILEETAIAAGFPEIAIFALETVLENEPGNSALLHGLGRLYLQHDQAEKAVEIYNRISELNPLDLEAVKLAKDASAKALMQKGGWSEAQSYRDLIKDKDLAASLEQQNRLQTSDASLEDQINEIFLRHEAQPTDVELAKRLGALHDQKSDLEGASAWYEYALALTNEGDPGLLRKLSDLRMRQLERQIRDDEALLAEYQAGDTEFTARAVRLEAAKKERAEFLIAHARKRLDRNPTDLQSRYELGEQLTYAGKYRDALPELQRARQNPNARLKAMNLLGHCYRELGMLDLAAKQLDDAAREMTVMDGLKKEIVYNLGLVYEQMAQHDKYIEAMKKIYQADYGYRDVAQRVESSYSSSDTK